MISKKTKYGLIAMFYLAKRYDQKDQGLALITDIAESERIPKKFLELILLDLKNHGILKSRRGKGGGYVLNRAPREIFLGQIIRILEGPLAPVPCVSQTSYQRCEECLEERCCGIRLVMKDVREAMARILDSTSLADAIEKSQIAGHENNLTYHI